MMPVYFGLCNRKSHQAIKHKQAIIGGGYLFTENACKKVYMSLFLDSF